MVRENYSGTVRDDWLAAWKSLLWRGMRQKK